MYIKKDTHPVYVQETSRIRAKMKKLKEMVKIPDISRKILEHHIENEENFTGQRMSENFKKVIHMFICLHPHKEK